MVAAARSPSSQQDSVPVPSQALADDEVAQRSAAQA